MLLALLRSVRWVQARWTPHRPDSAPRRAHGRDLPKLAIRVGKVSSPIATHRPSGRLRMNELEAIIGGRAGRVYSIGFGFRSARATRTDELGQTFLDLSERTLARCVRCQCV